MSLAAYTACCYRLNICGTKSKETLALKLPPGLPACRGVFMAERSVPCH